MSYIHFGDHWTSKGCCNQTQKVFIYIGVGVGGEWEKGDVPWFHAMHVVKFCRFYSTSWGQGLCFGVKSDDILYCTLPLYHSAGGMLVVGTMLLRGCTLVLKRKFSATNFWTDCRKHSCTVSVFFRTNINFLKL